MTSMIGAVGVVHPANVGAICKHGRCDWLDGKGAITPEWRRMLTARNGRLAMVLAWISKHHDLKAEAPFVLA